MASRSLNGVEIRVVEEPAREAAGFLIEHARRGGHIALSGGSAPGPAYELAAQNHPDWTGAHVWFGDDRVVPPGDNRSNYRLVRTTLLDSLSRSPEVHRIRGERPAEEAAALYDEELDGVTLDLALNGIGPDGHTASLFPALARAGRTGTACGRRRGRARALRPARHDDAKGLRRDGRARLPGHRRGEGAGREGGVRRRAQPGDAGERDPRPDDDRDPRRGSRVTAPSGVTARPGAAGDEPAEPVPVTRDEPVGGTARAPDRAVRPEQVRALEAHVLGQAREQRLGGGIVEGEEREPSEIETGDDTRREAAEASAAVVEQHRTFHGSSADSSSAAISRRPASAWSTSTVSATGMSSRYSSRVSNESSTSSTAST